MNLFFLVTLIILLSYVNFRFLCFYFVPLFRFFAFSRSFLPRRSALLLLLVLYFSFGSLVSIRWRVVVVVVIALFPLWSLIVGIVFRILQNVSGNALYDRLRSLGNGKMTTLIWKRAKTSMTTSMNAKTTTAVNTKTTTIATNTKMTTTTRTTITMKKRQQQQQQRLNSPTPHLF